MLILLFILLLSNCGNKKNGTLVNCPTPSAVVEEGEIERKSVEEIKNELQTQVDKSMISMRFNATPSKDADGFYNLMIECTSKNTNNYIVEITKADTGELLWKSPMMKPNHHIKKAKLQAQLPPGIETRCKVIYHGYNPNTNDYLGFVPWQITMYS